jgi:hypothetical protein
MKRDPRKANVMIIQAAFQGLLCLALFFNQGDLSKSKSLISGLFFIVVDHVMRNMMGTILIFQNERPVFLRE